MDVSFCFDARLETLFIFFSIFILSPQFSLANTHTHTHIYTYAFQSPSLSHTHYQSPSLTLSYKHSLSLTHSLTHTFEDFPSTVIYENHYSSSKEW